MNGMVMRVALAARGRNGFDIDATSLRGGTGISEIGLTWKPASYRGLYADLGVQGYTGTREGLTACLQVGRQF